MRKQIFFATVAVLIASSAAAQTYGDGSAKDYATRHFAQEDEAGYNMRSFDWRDGGAARTTSSGGKETHETAMQHFAQADEPEFGMRRWSEGVSGGVVASANGGSRADLSAYAAAKLDNGERGDN
jgi:hypothetical protein